MDANQYRAAIEALGLNQTSMAQLLGIDVRTSRRYALGESKVPSHTATVIRYMLQGFLAVDKPKRPVRKT